MRVRVRISYFIYRNQKPVVYALNKAFHGVRLLGVAPSVLVAIALDIGSRYALSDRSLGSAIGSSILREAWGVRDTATPAPAAMGRRTGAHSRAGPPPGSRRA